MRVGWGLIDLLCSCNALGLVCLVGRSFWSVWFFWINFQSDQPTKPDRRDRPDEPAFAGRAQWEFPKPMGWPRSRSILAYTCDGEPPLMQRDSRMYDCKT